MRIKTSANLTIKLFCLSEKILNILTELTTSFKRVA